MTVTITKPTALADAGPDGALPTEIAAIEAEGITKTFGATVALDDVSLRVAPGTVHALLGENGAGKSTMVKLLSGLIVPDSGAFRIYGEAVRLGTPRAAHRSGIQTAFQEMTLVDDLTVLDNMLLPYAPLGPSGMIRRRAARREVEAHFERIGLAGIDLFDEVRDLDLAIQQKIEIARAVWRRPRILLLDEPTSTLSGRDVDWLGDLVARLRAEGTTIVFISHRMREVRAFCDRLSVLRNGRHITTADVGDVSDAAVVEMIVGRSIAQTFPPRPADPARFGPEVLRVDGLSAGEKLKGASFRLRQGEILGVAGLQGMGQLDLFLAAYGMTAVHGGTVAVDGRPVTITSPVDALRPNIAIGLLPEDRKTEALFLKLSGQHNASLPVVSRFARRGLISERAEGRAVGEAFDRVNVDRRALWTRVGAFSGGNQQKIAIARWLVAESRVLLLFDPTRGIDVGTKHELYVLMRDYVAAGGAILFHSTEIPELVHLSDRCLVLYGGHVVDEIGAERLTEGAIVRAALGSPSTLTEAAR